MTSLVYGGSYLEKCISPPHDSISGSGLRAAEVVSILSPKIQHVLATTRYSSTEKVLEGLLARLGNITLHPQCPTSGANDPPLFGYLNPLAYPEFHFKQPPEEDEEYELESDAALIFGTIESAPRIKARIAVFDPQSPKKPSHFWDNGSIAERCALVLNHKEATRLSGEKSIFTAVKFLQQKILKSSETTYEVIVVKMAHAGCWVCTGDSIEAVPAFRTTRVFSIGSGDVFSAAFYVKWALEGESAANAAYFASHFTARFCESGVLAIEGADSRPLEALPLVIPDAPVHKKKIYLAGPFFSQGEIYLIDQIRGLLQTPWSEVFSPFHDVGVGPPEIVYDADIAGLEESDIVFAVITGTDPGTIFEIGYAIKANKKVFCLAESVPIAHLTMIIGSGAVIDSDITSAIYKVLWATLE